MPNKLYYLGEEERGCGYRVVGGLYLVGSGQAVECDRLPYPLHVCPTCGSGIKPSRGWTWVDWNKFAGVHIPLEWETTQEEGKRALVDFNKPIYCKCHERCPVCKPAKEVIYGLLWVGGRYYTPDSFVAEALARGISKRIGHVPKGLKLGETWVLYAHKEACESEEEEGKKVPGVFYASKPQRIVKILLREMATEDELERLRKMGITPIIVDANQCSTKQPKRRD